MHPSCVYEAGNYHLIQWTAVGVGAVASFACWPRTYAIAIGASGTETILYTCLYTSVQSGYLKSAITCDVMFMSIFIPNPVTRTD